MEADNSDNKNQTPAAPAGNNVASAKPVKKPKFPVLRKVLKWTGICLACIVLLWILVSAVWNWRASVRLDEKLAELRRRGEFVCTDDVQRHHEKLMAEIENNGAFLYAAAFDAAKNIDANKTWKELPIIGDNRAADIGAKLSPETLLQVRDFLEKQKRFFQLVEMAQQCERAVFPRHYTDGAATPLPELARIRKCAHIMLLKSYYASCLGHTDGAVDALETAFKLGECLTDDWTIISKLVHVAVCQMTVSQLEHLVSAATPARDMLSRLDALVPARIDTEIFVLAFVAERAAVGMWAFDEILSGRTTVGSLIGEEIAAEGLLWIAFPSGVLKDQCIRYLDFLTGIIDGAKLPPREARARIREKYAAFEKERAEGGILWQAQNFMLSLLLPALGSCYDSHLAANQRLLLAHTALAVERFRCDTGTLPERLEELVPQYLREEPEDYFSDGKARYRKDGVGFTVWSIGSDGKDNDGARNLSDTSGRDGHDIVFRVTR